ncbi:MAG: hypothetical protein PHR51_00395 [Patescibacteria group bacterium]|nr:hypothetical protein [Patescibacteria group bacterium]
MRKSISGIYIDPVLLDVLADIDPFLPVGYVLTGSCAYQVLLPNLANHPAKDLDLVVYPPKGSKYALVDPSIVDKFFVVRVYLFRRGYRYALVHKQTGCWVDIFPRRSEPHFIEAKTQNGRNIRISRIEETAYGICLGNLEKICLGKTVSLDFVNKLKRLTPFLDMKLFSEIVRSNSEETEGMTSFFDHVITPHNIIGYASNPPRALPTPGAKLSDYPTQCVVDPNGVAVEEPSVYSQAANLCERFRRQRQ